MKFINFNMRKIKRIRKRIKKLQVDNKESIKK